MSTIKVDKLQGTSGSATGLTFSGANGTFGGTLAVTGVHTVGNNAVATSEGGAVTISAIQGLNKQWATWAADQSIDDSFNTSGVADTATGKATVSFSAAMNNITYAVVTAGSNGNASATIYSSDPNNPATGSYICNIFFASNGTAFGLADRAHNYSSVNGDLA